MCVNNRKTVVETVPHQGAQTDKISPISKIFDPNRAIELYWQPY